MANEVWVFNGDNARFPSGVFASRQSAEAWISRHRLTGVLTKYPVDMGVYDWAVQNAFFTPKRPDQHSPNFIGGFTSASLDHVHFEDGHVITDVVYKKPR
jgi:hypothetical protein